MPKTVSQLLRKLSRERFRITFPTVLTILRLVLTPFIVLAMIFQFWGAAFGLFLVLVLIHLLIKSYYFLCFLPWHLCQRRFLIYRVGFFGLFFLKSYYKFLGHLLFINGKVIWKYGQHYWAN